MGRKDQWSRVDRQHPCPVCGHDSYCGVSPDGTTVRCMRVASAKESRGSDGAIGYIHKMDGVQAPRSEPKEPKPKLSTAELTDLAKRMCTHPKASLARANLSERLGVTVESLEALKVGYGADRRGEYSSWPERDWKGTIVGINRRYEDGEKKRYPGGSSGLSYAADWFKRPGPVLIVEGGSDAAAVASVGLPGIGRPSNVSGGPWVKRLLARANLKTAIVVGEDDEKPERRGQYPDCPKECEGCGRCWPGLYGAKLVSGVIGCGYVMPPPGSKDFRDAFNRGLLWPELLRAVR